MGPAADKTTLCARNISPVLAGTATAATVFSDMLFVESFLANRPALASARYALALLFSHLLRPKQWLANPHFAAFCYGVYTRWSEKVNPLLLLNKLCK